jgi:hypothetical protein
MPNPSGKLYKLHPDGTVKEYHPEEMPNDWVLPYGNTRNQPGEPVIRCGCGSESFRVSWWDYPYTGGYCRVVCIGCGQSRVLINDYA